ncbi:GMC family oxidoreductase [bacterium]|nr:GMC family oxidoreductase [bacterium]
MEGHLVIGGGWCRPLDKIDFKDYPINKADLDPYLSAASDVLEIKGDFNRDIPFNNDFNQIQFQFSPPVRFGLKYREYIEKSSLIDLVLNAYVLNINQGNLEGSADYLEVADEKLKSLQIKVNNVIVACGGIENNRLLLWSQHVNKNLFANLKIGSKWMDHPHFVTGEMIADDRKIHKMIDSSSDFIKHYLFLSPNEPMITNEIIGNAGIRLKILQEKDATRTNEIINDILCTAPNYGKKLAALAKKNLICTFKVRIAWEKKPSDENKVELDFNNKDQYGVPRTKLTYKYNQDDKRTARICMEKLGAFFLSEDIGRIGVLPYLYDYSNEIPHKHNFYYGHHMGGTQMGTSEINGVVDRNLKVFNTRNVWVAGSSVFTSAGHANPTLSIVQFSLRLSDYLSKKTG